MEPIEQQAPQPGPGMHQPDPARRQFLKVAPLGALAVVAGAAKADVPAPATPAPTEAPVQSGYHETEHIRRYYATAAYW